MLVTVPLWPIFAPSFTFLGSASCPTTLVYMFPALTWPNLLTSLLDGEDLSIAEATWAMREIVRGDATSAQIASFLVALRVKGETVSEMVGFRDAVLEEAVPLHVNPIGLDIVGTGGDRFGTVNVSTMAAIVAAATGVPVIKHGNRAASSQSGASDVLGALGLDLSLPAERVAQILTETGITFAYAALFHPGFANAAATRSQIGIPTVFNYLGPLCNPARPEASAIGVSQLDRVPLIVGVLQTRGATALVFRGDDGLDELTTTGHSHIWEVSRGLVTEHDLEPRDLGIERATIQDLVGGDPEHNARVVRETLAGASGPIRDIVLLNTAAGLVAYRLSLDVTQGDRNILDRFQEELAVAAVAIDSGRATAKLEEWVRAQHP